MAISPLNGLNFLSSLSQYTNSNSVAGEKQNKASITSSVEISQEAYDVFQKSVNELSDTNDEFVMETMTTFTVVPELQRLVDENPEYAEKLEKLAERLDSDFNPLTADAFGEYASRGMLTKEFIDFTEELTDEELHNMQKTLSGLKINSTTLQNWLRDAETSYTENYAGKLDSFLNIIMNSSDEDRTKILDQGAKYANEIVSGAIYNHSSATNLQNYLLALTSADDPSSLVKAMDGRSDEARKHLLDVYNFDESMGNRLLDILDDRGEDITDEFINVIGNSLSIKYAWPSDRTSEFNHLPLSGDKLLQTEDSENTNTSRPFAERSFDNALTLLEDHNFTSGQLKDMASDLGGMSVSDQRSYLEITRQGMDMLMDENLTGKQMDFDKALEIVDSLRNNRSVLHLMDRTRFNDVSLVQSNTDPSSVHILEGEKAITGDTTLTRTVVDGFFDHVKMENGKSVKSDVEAWNLYMVKDPSEYRDDAKNMIGTLISYVDMNANNDSAGLSDFADNLAGKHSAVRDSIGEKVTEAVVSEEFRSKLTENTKSAFFSSLVLQMEFETRRDFKESANFSL